MRKAVCAREQNLDDRKHQKRRSSVFVKYLAKTKEIATKNKSVNQDSTINSLVHPVETLDNETLQATTHSGHNDRGQTTAQTEFTCAVSQVKRILNTCDIGYETTYLRMFH